MLTSQGEDSELTISGLIIGVITLVDGILKSVRVPAILEVGVPGVASGVTLISRSELHEIIHKTQHCSPSGVDERPLISSGLPPRCEFGDIPGNLIISRLSNSVVCTAVYTYLVKELHEGNRVCRRAFSVVETREVSGVGHVVWGIEVLIFIDEDLVNKLQKTDIQHHPSTL